MTVAPFGGEKRDGSVYGRGASDVKGAMAAMLAALSRIETGAAAQDRPTIVIAFTVNEECGFIGARSLVELWQPDRQAGARVTSGTISATELFPRPPDLAIVAEPTDLNVVVAHQGMVRWHCHATGLAAHSSRPHEGINAIYAMGRVTAAIEAYGKQLAAGPGHPLCGHPAVCVTMIEGGVGINIVPDSATITIDRRIGPDEQPAAAFADLVRFIAQNAELGVARVDHEPPFLKSTGLSNANNGPLAEQLVQLVKEFGRESRLIGAPYGTDAAAIGAAGVPTVVFGPGSVRQAHTADEHIEVSELELGAKVYERIATRSLLVQRDG
jgi:acetylornithine deacetylase/succinyl-diaminopimelate desuccinylase-like protein